MTERKKRSQAVERRPKQDRDGIERRSFLKRSAAGLGVLTWPALAGSTLTAANASQEGSQDVGEHSPAAAPRGSVNYATQADNWVEPWEWVQADWPGQQLHLNVIENAAPIAIFGSITKTSDANVGQFLFSYNGISPGPTLRVRGNETLHVKVRNMLPPNDGVLCIPEGSEEHGGEPPIPKGLDKAACHTGASLPQVPTTPIWDYCRPLHLNGPHQAHTTNLHTHGLHVQPYLNPDGTNGDNVFLRIIPQGDYKLREATQDPSCWPLKGSEAVGEADYEFRLGTPSGARQPHPPGTHWYHPHSHGATFPQVASGMAGLLIVEGDVDDRLREQLDYTERPMVIQRIVGPKALDIEQGFQKDGQPKTKSPNVFPAINGSNQDNFMVIRPGAIERWRVLNAGVDGQAYLAFSVVEGESEQGEPYGNLHHLAMDGITLVNEEGEYHTRPLRRPLMLSPANRADLLFQAPRLDGDDPKILTIWASWVENAADTTLPIFDFASGKKFTPPAKVATIIVRGKDSAPVRAARRVDLARARLAFPEVPEYLKPVTEEEVTVKRGDPDGGLISNLGLRRSRQKVYSGWGGAGMNAFPTSRLNALMRKHRTPQNPAFVTKVTAQDPDTMMIDARKFDDDPEALQDIRPRMLKDTAEEWTVWNCTLTRFPDDPKEAPTEVPRSFDRRRMSFEDRPYPTQEQRKQITPGAQATRGVDHPFHIHVNPFWVLGIFDWNDRALGWNYELVAEGDEFYPRWQDVIRLPRNGGRVVFRARFWDYAGAFVNHCHILQHEDNGMMQGVEVVTTPEQANYVAYDPVVGRLPSRVSWHDCYTLNWGVVTEEDRRACDAVLERLRNPA